VTTFGAIPPGKTVTRTAEIPLPQGRAPWPYTVLVELRGPGGRVGKFVEVKIPVK
jgi:hypothetical protein